MPRLTRISLLLLLVGTFGLAACGDDDTADDAADDTSGTTGAEEAEALTVPLAIEGSAFDPAELTIPAGSTVKVTNNDSFPHTWTADDGSFDSGSLEGGASFEFTFEDSGGVSYHCTIHPNMTGGVIVE